MGLRMEMKKWEIMGRSKQWKYMLLTGKDGKSKGHVSGTEEHVVEH